MGGAGGRCGSAGRGAVDRAALEALYDATGGAGWTDSTSWKTPAPLGEWHGVTTDGAGRVSRLVLRDNGLAGPIPPDVGNLAHLEGLFLDNNDLTGPVPAELGSLANLRSLVLNGNRLTGPIPRRLERLTNLRSLNLGYNRLSGPVPAFLGTLAGLESLSVRGNDLTGPIPGALGGLVNLEDLALAENRLSGPVPGELGSLASLEQLLLGSNPLTGTLPRRLTALSRLAWLDIEDTEACAPADDEFQAWLAGIRFEGATCNRPPRAVGAVPAQVLAESGPARRVPMDGYFDDPDGNPLSYAAASGNAGAVTAAVDGGDVWLVPGTAGTATVTVTARDRDGESATQAIAVTTAASAGPQSDRDALEALYDATGGAAWTESASWKTSAPLGSWHGVTTGASGRVTRLSLERNGLAGPIPPALGSLDALVELNLSLNDLAGPVPDALGRLANLTDLSLRANDLIGPVPDALGGLANLQRLDLAWNHLSGVLPARLGDLTSLWQLELSGNSFTGRLPAELARLTSLEELVLTRAGVTGPIPPGLGNLARLRSLWLDENALTGPIPAGLGRLADLEFLGLSENALTGPIPSGLGSLARLQYVDLSQNALTGPIPAGLGNLANLSHLDLQQNGLSGPIPGDLGNLANLSTLGLLVNWGLSGPLPAGLRRSRLDELDLLLTRTCAPADWADWLDTIGFRGPLCGSGPDVTIDVAVVYTPAAREAAGGAPAIRTLIDLWVAESNQAYAAGGARQRIGLAAAAEAAYVESGDAGADLRRLVAPSDGHMDGAHALRDRSGADLVHVVVAPSSLCGIANLGGPFGLTNLVCGGDTFTHELGHNMGLLHDRFAEGGGDLHPAYGYVNQPGLAEAAPPSRRWRTVMAYDGQCEDAYTHCPRLLRFSNPRQRYDGDPMGVPFRPGEAGLTGPADAAAVLDVTAGMLAGWRDRPAGANRPPAAVGALPDRTLRPRARLGVDVSRAFVDPDGDALAYGASSSAPHVATVGAAGARVTVTAVGEGVAAIRVTATDPGGLSASHAFTVTVSATAPVPFTDDPIVPGVTPVRAVHFTELRSRIDGLRAAAGLGRSAWTDPVLTAGVTPVRLTHLLELREALAAAYAASGRSAPRWTDPAPMTGTTPVRAAHLTELRAAVIALE